jgi:hypothetical protein
MTNVFAADNTDTTVTSVDALVGEGKKFKSVDDLAKGKVEADAYIETLKGEIETLRVLAVKPLNAETELNELREQIKTLRENRTVERPREHTTSELTHTDVKTLVEQTITQRETNKTAEQNIAEANQAMVEHFGSLQAATAHFKKRARELNISEKWLQDTAAQSPRAFLEHMALDSKSNPETFVSGVHSTDALRQTPTGQTPKEGTKAHFDKLRKENPRKYISPEIQLQILKAVEAGTYYPR